MRNRSWGENKKSLLDKIIEKARFNKISKFIFKNSTVLDLGCGYNANLLNYFSNKIKKGYGLDLSISKSTNNRIELIKGRADQRIELKSNSIDLITALAISEHVDKPDIMFHECFRLLKKNGRMLITTPSKYSKPILEFMANLGLIDLDEINDHKRYYDKKTLFNDLNKAGFDSNKIEIKYFQLGMNIFAKIVK